MKIRTIWKPPYIPTRNAWLSPSCSASWISWYYSALHVPYYHLKHVCGIDTSLIMPYVRSDIETPEENFKYRICCFFLPLQHMFRPLSYMLRSKTYCGKNKLDHWHISNGRLSKKKKDISIHWIYSKVSWNIKEHMSNINVYAY